MKRHILIVEDNRIERAMLSSALEKDYIVSQAENGSVALSFLRNTSVFVSAIIVDLMMPVTNGFELLKKIQDNAVWSQIPVIVTTGFSDDEMYEKALSLGAISFLVKPYSHSVLLSSLSNCIHLRETASIINVMRKDKLTGIYNRAAFFDIVSKMIKRKDPGYYVLSCFDVENFKIINDQYGTEKGDEVLRHIAKTLQDCNALSDGACCRVMADKFAVLYPAELTDSPDILNTHNIGTNPPCLDRAIKIRIGRYIIDDTGIPVNSMFDRASLAEESIRGRYDVYVAYYTRSMLDRLIKEQDIVSRMHGALERGEFEVWLQPLYNHATGKMISAEALVRWKSEGMMISPQDFIPVFERNGFIYEMDKYVWERVCSIQRDRLDEKKDTLPISVNVSRCDLFHVDFIDILVSVTARYNIPHELLHLEITESAFSDSPEQMITIVKKLISLGFSVEIDDFGSGYSSLNILKDVPAKVIKLDIKFLENTEDSRRGGNILESVVRMARWLGMTIIAEGVETKAQADYLKSVGCDYIQGYYYAKPMPENEFLDYADRSIIDCKLDMLETAENLDNNAFWDPASMETLIFNSYVGGACIFEYHEDKLELIRANDRYYEELCFDITDGKTAAQCDPAVYLDEENKARMIDNMKEAIRTGRESSREIICRGGDKKVYIRSTLRVIAKSSDSYLFYCVVSNITDIKERDEQLQYLNETMLNLMNKTPGGFVQMRVSDDGTVSPEYCNDGFDQLVGMTREQSRGIYRGNVLNGVHKDDVRIVKGIIKKMMTLGEAHNVRCRLLNGSGGYTWVSVSGQMTRDKNGDIILNAYYSDATEDVKRENEQNELIDNLPYGAGLYEYDGKSLTVVHLSKRYWALVGRSESDDTKTNFTDYVHPDDRQIILREVTGGISVGRDLSCDIRIKCKDDRYYPFRVIGRVIKNKKGTYSIYASHVPLSDEVLSIQDVLSVALRTIMTMQTQFAFIKDTNLRYISCSRAALAANGMKSEAEIIGMTDYDLFPEELADSYTAQAMKVIESGEPLIGAEETVNVPGIIQGHRFSSSIYPLKDKNGTVVGIYGVGHDIG